MGLLVDGVWKDQWYDTKSSGGKFVRQASAFRNQITADGSSGFPAESGRYHLYASFACPWASRTLIFRKLKCLEDAISISIVDPLMLENGWSFSDWPGCVPDTINGVQFLYEIYQKAEPIYTGRVTVPVLWDIEKGTIVSNESSEIIRMLNCEFNDSCDCQRDVDYCPDHLRPEIDRLNEWIYSDFNNGVYRCGFATTQEAYEKAFISLFDAVDRLEALLEDNDYLAGDRLTEVDWRFFTTAVRFDPVYYGHFKCNKKRIADCARLSAHLKKLYRVDGIADTVNMDHIKRHYYGSHRQINPTGIIPLGPDLDLE